MFRAKEHEEDILIKNEIHNIDFTISLKAYGDGPLQLSTDRHSKMFPRLQQEGERVVGRRNLARLFDDVAFQEFGNVNVLPLIYAEVKKRCNIMVFDFGLAKARTNEIRLEKSGAGRTHPVYRFYDKDGHYICEVRYGNAFANALQRGLWTNTKNALAYFNSVTGGWIDYSDSVLLVKLFSHALVSTNKGHEGALRILEADIQAQKEISTLNDRP